MHPLHYLCSCLRRERARRQLAALLNRPEDMALTVTGEWILKDPPPTPYIILNGPVNGQYYDKVGRAFMFGARARF